MKFLCVLLLFAFTGFGQEIFSKDTALEQIIASLYDGKVQMVTGEVAWKPNTGECFQFMCDNGEILYTSTDTTFTYHNGTTKMLVIATETHRKTVDGKRVDCHNCAPALGLVIMEDAPEAQHYAVTQFYKYVTHYGTWGRAANLSLLVLGDGYPVVVEDWHYFGQGIDNNGKRFFFNGHDVLAIDTSRDNQAGVEEGHGLEYAFDTHMDVDEKAGILTFTRTGTGLDNDGNIVPFNSIARYTFNPIDEVFVKGCE
jgi:hypothetical protein